MARRYINPNRPVPVPAAVLADFVEGAAELAYSVPRSEVFRRYVAAKLERDPSLTIQLLNLARSAPSAAAGASR